MFSVGPDKRYARLNLVAIAFMKVMEVIKDRVTVSQRLQRDITLPLIPALLRDHIPPFIMFVSSRALPDPDALSRWTLLLVGLYGRQ